MLDRARGESAQRQAEAITTERVTVASGRIADDMTAFVLKRP
jgi:serine phosphatase RsbU (regulator of sigma subunit)